MPRQTRQQERIKDAVNAAYREHGDGVQVDVMDLGKILRAGEEAGEDGRDIGEAIRSALATYRKN